MGKQAGKPSARNGHAGFDVAGAGNRLTVRLVRHSQRKRGATDRPNLRSMAPVLDPTDERGGKRGDVRVATAPNPDSTHPVYDPNCHPNAWYCRDIRMQKMSWNADGSPNLGVPIDPHVTQKAPSGDPGSVGSAHIR